MTLPPRGAKGGHRLYRPDPMSARCQPSRIPPTAGPEIQTKTGVFRQIINDRSQHICTVQRLESGNQRFGLGRIATSHRSATQAAHMISSISKS